MASYSDIARMTGLSFGTISNVISNKGHVKEANREKVLQAMKELNYRVDFQARSLASDRTHMIGLVVSDLNNVSQAQIMMPLISFAKKNHCRVIVSTCNNSDQEKRACEEFLSSKVDGLFVFLEHVENREYFKKLEETEKTPIIFLSRYLDDCGLPHVAVDNIYAGKCMVDYVYKMGHRSVTYLGNMGRGILSPFRDRREGVRSECERLGMGFRLLTFEGEESDIALGYRMGEELIRKGNLPKLVIPRNDSISIGFYNACLRHGLSVPEDVSIMSFGNFYEERITPRRLSTFDRCFGRMVEASVDLYTKIFNARRNGEDESGIEKAIFIKGKLIEGETVKKVNPG